MVAHRRDRIFVSMLTTQLCDKVQLRQRGYLIEHPRWPLVWMDAIRFGRIDLHHEPATKSRAMPTQRRLLSGKANKRPWHCQECQCTQQWDGPNERDNGNRTARTSRGLARHEPRTEPGLVAIKGGVEANHRGVAQSARAQRHNRRLSDNQREDAFSARAPTDGRVYNAPRLWPAAAPLLPRGQPQVNCQAAKVTSS